MRMTCLSMTYLSAPDAVPDSQSVPDPAYPSPHDHLYPYPYPYPFHLL